ncbi:MAG: STAS domain-containing protein [Ilumatobacter sp.]|jgi:anti-anti-sigma factor|uniref:STAS domain-containing protein n=1 Tax=Ilumatobacter sp. TaxID=1967498 RepID=UPI00391CFB97
MSPPQSRLDIHVGDAELRVSGEIDAHSAAELADRLAAMPADRDRRLDVSAVDFMDSSGLRVLIDAHQTAEELGTRLVLVSPGPAVSRIIEVSGLTNHLHVDHADSV